MLSIFSRLHISVLKIAKSRNALTCSASTYVSNAFLRTAISDVIKKICPIIKMVFLSFTYQFLRLVENNVHHLLAY